jgi:hypothetical protein
MLFCNRAYLLVSVSDDRENPQQNSEIKLLAETHDPIGVHGSLLGQKGESAFGSRSVVPVFSVRVESAATCLSCQLC